MILIISRETDQSTSDVIKWLIHFKKKFIRINFQEIIDGEVFIDMHNDEIHLTKNEEVINFKEISSFWYRRGEFSFKKNTDFSVPLFKDELNTVIENEINTVANYLHYKLAQKKHINSRLQNSVNKLYVIDCARRCNLLIPDTIVTTSKQRVLDFLKKHEKVVTKPLYEIPLFAHDIYGQVRIYTELLTKEKVENIKDTFQMSLFQKCVIKKYEIRVFILNQKIYSMAIFSQNDSITEIDFRKYNVKKPNRNVPFNLPKKIEQQLINLMNSIGINCGSIDMLKSIDDKYYFLEVNPIGQFGMTSYPCHYPIEKEIATYLAD